MGKRNPNGRTGGQGKIQSREKAGQNKCPVGVTAMKFRRKIEEKNGDQKTLNF